MKITLNPGETLEVEFKNTDGTVKVSYGDEEIKIESDCSDSSGRVGEIYYDNFKIS